MTSGPEGPDVQLDACFAQLRSLRGARGDALSVLLGAAAGSVEVLGAAVLGAAVLGAAVLGAVVLGVVVLGDGVTPGPDVLGGDVVLGDVPPGCVVWATATATNPARVAEAAMVNAFGNFLM